MTDPHEITRLLANLREGDAGAAPKLIPLVYDELRRIAAHLMRDERRNHTLEPTALVHEAYVHLVAQEAMSWENRAHFFGVAARLMRWILLDYARRRGAEKRGGQYRRLPLEEAPALTLEDPAGLLAVDEALTRLERLDPKLARIVELRYFVGLNIEETAEALRISTATVKREWNAAKAWLKHELEAE